MKIVRYATLSLAFIASAATGYAQDQPNENKGDTTVVSTETKKKVSYHFHIYAPPKPGKGYVTAGGNGPLLSFANVKNLDERVRNIPALPSFSISGPTITTTLITTSAYSVD